ncbi:flagellar biosynthetic protein FlhB [Desulfofundulus australicus DSM 11792]|uniref:Flagellar biosynthetic protein FlhB n=1 Tax=Desulfofundulus australicus DSM 11792 TaxID=1121425 RepID=A0A1M4VJ77_9FIRM|nr:flagellar biosynthesis protein FlhB [Desulfofundulus australicus]SHE69061.1 flagellar biosynthetic protein FlhB [Desulfofundulus australicus DSM 11792]
MAHGGGAQQKTEAPTPRRLQEARRRGQVPRSRDFAAAVVLMAAVTLAYLLKGPAMESWQKELTWYFSHCLTFDLSPESLPRVIFDAGRGALWMCTPLMLTLTGAALAVHLLQTGFIFAPEVVKPNLERINPVSGLSRIFSLRTLVELGKSILKVAVVAGVSYLVVKAYLPELLLVFHRSPRAAFDTVAGVMLAAAAAAGGTFLLLAVLDLFYQRWEYLRGLRMTRQEVKDELKQTEGDPTVKSWQRRRQRQILLNRIRQEVPRATVVITNPTHLAVALRYDEREMPAPRVVAKGAGDLARRIRELAAEHNVPVIHNPEVARTLYHQVEIGQEIPVELYQAVAQILALVYRLKKRPV